MAADRRGSVTVDGYRFLRNKVLIDEEVEMRVLIAADASEHAVAVAESAHRLFGDDAEYLVVNVEPVPGLTAWAAPYGAVSPMFVPTAAAGVASPSDTRVVEVAARDCAEHVAVTSYLRADVIGRSGDPAAMIVQAAHEHGVDVVAVGANHHSWLGRLLTGSVCGEVLRDSDGPVLVVQ
jgi:nucleotide-binding universal stress UspA family protein